MEVVPAQGALLERVLDETCPTFSEGLDRRGYGQWETALMKTAWARRSRRRFALVHGRDLLASAVHYDLAGTLDGRSVRICGIGSVFTEARHQGRGHQQMLVEKLLGHAAQSGAEIALLFSRPELDEETHRGFEALPSAVLNLRVTESTRRGAPMTMVRSGGDRDLPAIVAMGRARAEPFRFHLERDVDLVQFFIAEEGTTAAAYVVLSVVGRTWMVEECGDRDAGPAPFSGDQVLYWNNDVF